MKILVAPDSFKDSLEAPAVARHLAIGIQKAGDPAVSITTMPLADGGEGTVRSLVEATGGRLVEVEVHDPLMRKIPSFFGILGDGTTAVIEMAAASGLELLKEEERNPLKTTTYGTGELIKKALTMNCRRIIVGIGGSATVDGGVGMIQALGGKLLNGNGTSIGFGGAALEKLNHIDLSQVKKRLQGVEILAACDVNNPLYGSNGAAFIYAPQKGATLDVVYELEANMKHLAHIVKKELGKDIPQIKGAGAAGGLGAGLVAFCDATLRPGFEIVAEVLQLENIIKDADLIITGEGKLDGQTRFGKTPYGVAQLAKKYGKPVIGIAGTLGEGAEELHHYGIDALFSILDCPMSLNEALKSTPACLERLGFEIMQLLKIKL